MQEASSADITVMSAGSELSFAVNIAQSLAKSNIIARIVSFPSHKIFREQPIEYQRKVLRRNEGIPAVVVEPYVSLGWERYADAGVCMQGYGHSLPGKYIYEHFGFETENMVQRIEKFLRNWKAGNVERGEFVEL